MKTLSKYLADNFSSQFCTRVEPQSNGYLLVWIGYPSNGTESTRMLAWQQVRNELLVEAMLEDMRKELTRPH